MRNEITEQRLSHPSFPADKRNERMKHADLQTGNADRMNGRCGLADW
uniref:Uncharacterized protein n=1 Tax=Setaria digitata TaxID=48799 RepID=A0A915PMC7_9BILA